MRGVFKRIVLKILEWEARLVLRKYKPKIVAVSGSVGKTTTKNMIHAVMDGGLFVRKNEKSYNTEFGVPLTILGLPNAWYSPMGWLRNIFKGFAVFLLPNVYPKWLVLEIGVEFPGDMEHIVSFVKPDIVVMTAMGSEVPVHSEFFSTPAEIVEEKAKLVEAVKEHGTVILNRDDELVWEMRKKINKDPHNKTKKIISYGEHKEATVRGTGYHLNLVDNIPQGLAFRADLSGHSLPIRLTGVVGKGYFYCALAALAVGESLGLNAVAIDQAIESVELDKGRSQILLGKNGSIILDESYNLSAAALKLSMQTLKELPDSNRRIVLLSEMTEIGEHSKKEHEKVGEWLAGAGVDLLCLVGDDARYYVAGGMKRGLQEAKVKYFENSVECGKYVSGQLKSGDVVLVKGAQRHRMEKAIEELLAEPQKAQELLVRQDQVWREK